MDLEAQAKADKLALAELEFRARRPVVLPSLDLVARRVFDLEMVAKEHPTEARFELARYFEDGHVRIRPQPEGYYLAESVQLPLVLMAGPQKHSAQVGDLGCEKPLGCAGRI